MYEPSFEGPGPSSQPFPRPPPFSFFRPRNSSSPFNPYRGKTFAQLSYTRPGKRLLPRNKGNLVAVGTFWRKWFCGSCKPRRRFSDHSVAHNLRIVYHRASLIIGSILLPATDSGLILDATIVLPTNGFIPFFLVHGECRELHQPDDTELTRLRYPR